MINKYPHLSIMFVNIVQSLPQFFYPDCTSNHTPEIPYWNEYYQCNECEHSFIWNSLHQRRHTAETVSMK